MKNITLSADEYLIERAREVARQRSTTLNELFRQWLASLSGQTAAAPRYDRLMKRLQATVSAGRKFSREEMNAR